MQFFSVRNVNKETPTYFKEVHCGDERQVVTTVNPEKYWDLETAWAIASLLNMCDKTGGHWETPEVNIQEKAYAFLKAIGHNFTIEPFEEGLDYAHEAKLHGFTR